MSSGNDVIRLFDIELFIGESKLCEKYACIVESEKGSRLKMIRGRKLQREREKERKREREKERCPLKNKSIM